MLNLRLIPSGLMALALTATLSAQAADPAPAFQSAEAFLTGRPGDQLAAYADLRTHLMSDFDQVCNSSFCSGKDGYTNLKPLSIACSVNTATELVGVCLWTIAGSVEEVNAQNGSVKVTKKNVFTCSLKMKGTVGQYMKAIGDAIAAPGVDPATAPALHAKLPDMDSSSFDQLKECLN